MLFAAACLTLNHIFATNVAVAAPAPNTKPVNAISTVSGKSQCSIQDLNVDVVASNINLLLDEPANQTIVTEILVELLQQNSVLFAKANGGPNIIKETYKIYGTLCIPSDPSAAKNIQTLQFLTHGDTLDSTYWDIAPGYSYIDAAVATGYATFAYDRIGVGKSEHPDPLQIVQGPLQVEIAHGLIKLIRNGQFGPHSFKIIVGVGHSGGSTVTQGVTTKYPQDFDAVILTGTSTSATFVNTALASFDLKIANTDGFWEVFRSSEWLSVLAIEVANKQTQTFGELLTIGTIVAPSTRFKGPVDVLLGENDLVFCGGDCTKPQDQSALVVPVFYPAATSSQHYIVPGAGHAIFAHYSAGKSFAQMLKYLQTNGL